MIGVQLLEEYVLASDKQEFFKKLIKGSPQHIALTLLHALNNRALDLTPEEQTYLTKAKSNGQYFFMLRQALLSLERSSKDEKAKSEACKFLAESFNFNYNFERPHKITGQGNQNVEKIVTYDSEIKPQQLQFDYIIKKDKPNNVICDNQLIDPANLNDSYIRQYLDNVNVLTTSRPDFLPFYINHVKKNSFYKPNHTILSCLTLLQLEKVIKEVPSFEEKQLVCASLFSKTFWQELQPGRAEPNRSESIIKRIDDLKRMRNWAIKRMPKHESLADEMLLEMLHLGIKVNKFDMELYLQYLERTPFSANVFNHEQQQRLGNKLKRCNYTQEWRTVHKLPCGQWKSQQNLHEDYLEAHFRQKDTLEPFAKYFRQDYLVQKQVRSKLMRGQEIEGLTDFMTSSELKELKEKRLLTLAQGNQLYFDVGEEVNLFLEIKNIPNLQVMVYELDMLNYYKKNNRELDDQIRLDGLLPNDLQEFTYKEPPVILVTRKFTFEKLTGKRGVFIIEFVGSGIISRAVIRLGKLIIREKLTVAGHAFELFNEKMEPCREEVGIYLDKTLYKGDAEGQIVIPLRKSALSTKGIAFHKDTTALFDIQISNEQFHLECQYVTCKESVVLNNKAKILARPRLYLNGCVCPFDLVNSASAEIITVSEPRVTASKNYEGLKLDKEKQLIFEFEVGPKIIEANLRLKVEVKNMDQKKVSLESHYSVKFDSLRGRNVLACQFLRRNQDGYCIQLLGKNGQPKKGFIANMNFFLFGYHKTVEKTLQTDAEGRIKLGHLKGIRRLTSAITPQGDIQVEKLSTDLIQLYSVPIQPYIQVIQKEPIVLPMPELLDPSLRLFRQTSENSCIEDLSGKVKIEQGKIHVDNLTTGKYSIVYSDIQNTQIVVMEGCRTKKNLILTPEHLITPSQLNPLFTVSSCCVKKEEKNLMLEAKLEGDSSKVHAHVFLGHFFDRNNYRGFVCGYGKNVENSAIPILTSGNTYLSNKPMGDELKYVLERKNKTIYIGNTLEKPSILLKREYVKDTSTKSEEVNEEGKFTKSDSAMMGKGIGFADQKHKPHKMDNSVTIFKFQDALALPGTILDNLRPNQHGLLRVSLPEGYSNLTVIFINDNDIIARELGLPTISVPVRDMRHKQYLKTGQYYTLQRTRSILRAGDKYQCADVTSTELKIIGSFNKLFSVMQSLCNTQGLSAHELNKLSFLKEWLSLTVEQKNEKYDEFYCHELNAFLYFNDAPYFEQEVVPFLKSKMSKEFMDYVLLEDQAKVMTFTAPALLKDLSMFQKACLVYFLRIKEHKECAEQVANAIELQARLVKVDKKHYKNLFDTVLNAAKLEDYKDAYLLESAAMEYQDQQKQCYNGGGGGSGMLNMNTCSASFSAAAPPPPSQAIKRMRAGKALKASRSSRMEIEQSQKYSEMRKAGSLMRGYTQLECTKEYNEKTWMFKSAHTHNFKHFYSDLANYLVKEKTTSNFISQDFILAENMRDILAVLIFMDLAEESCGKYETKDKGIVINIEGNAIAFQKELRETHEQLEAVTVFQKFFDNNQRTYQDEDGTWVEQEVKQFLINKIYGCQVIITNSTINPMEIDVLAEIPRGALPVNTIEYTKSQNMVISSYTTESFEYYFYFPHAGDFDIYPANAARNGKIVATAATHAFPVRLKRTQTELKTMSDILEKGTKKDILEFVSTRNIFNPQVFSFNDIYYLLKDRQFYFSLMAILRKRKAYDLNCWSFAYFHQDIQTIKQHLASHQAVEFFKRHLLYFRNSIVEYSNFNLRQYFPLVNQRAHPLKQRLNILNVDFKKTYVDLLQYLREKPESEHTGDDLLVLVYFLNLQDRIGQACDVLKRIDPAKVSCQLQYDYFRAYFDFYIDYPNFKTARALTDKYLTYPVIAWRTLFYDVANQLAEFDGEKPEYHHKKKDDTVQAERVQYLEAVLKDKVIDISYRNVSQIKLHYYNIDLELIFSRNPLISSGKEDFSFVKATRQELIKVASQNRIISMQIPLPKDLVNKNCYIVVYSNHRQSALTYFSSALKAIIDQDLGQLKVTDPSDKPLSKVYVKVIGQENNGNFVFFKDGYTDLRGRFDYVTKSQGSLSNVSKFALFVLSQEHGSIIKQARKPSGMDQLQARVNLINNQLKNVAQTRFNSLQQNYEECYRKQTQRKR